MGSVEARDPALRWAAEGRVRAFRAAVVGEGSRNYLPLLPTLLPPGARLAVPPPDRPGGVCSIAAGMPPIMVPRSMPPATLIAICMAPARKPPRLASVPHNGWSLSR